MSASSCGIPSSRWLAPRRSRHLLQVLEPATHLSLPSLPAAVPLRANVTMVCGCPIGTGEPWIPGDFEVFAEIRRAGAKKSVRVPLGFAGQTSLFTGSYEVREAGFYEATFTAIQKSTGNTGTGQVTFFYQAPAGRPEQAITPPRRPRP